MPFDFVGDFSGATDAINFVSDDGSSVGGPAWLIRFPVWLAGNENRRVTAQSEHTEEIFVGTTTKRGYVVFNSHAEVPKPPPVPLVGPDTVLSAAGQVTDTPTAAEFDQYAFTGSAVPPAVLCGLTDVLFAQSDDGPVRPLTVPPVVPELFDPHGPYAPDAMLMNQLCGQAPDVGSSVAVTFRLYSSSRADQSISTVLCQVYTYLLSTPIFVSDIDGTVTMSDTMGVIKPRLPGGLRSTHHHDAIGDTYTALAVSYQPLYLTARTVLMSPTTRVYLDAMQALDLPRGPVISMAAVRKDHMSYKAGVLGGIRRFLKEYGGPPMIAGFGNRDGDRMAYLLAGIRHRFTIDTASVIVDDEGGRWEGHAALCPDILRVVSQ
ncbi:LNS2 (Lipin/Ned1/Smp2) [Carpediemonas membranifera]|uniref:LNS2 (Lipin/Ned1/Smp2) n=1 Tax=Carpediemonas membranifera TaxID=201153 RepID=A0A8J6E720_9EUKA|nr:LNS2 (Lipin/Ned1/Smp2) [Carpediemonas membranifera]|eukprot:KAG9390190.1 LNS2 (Lipin/Ned1/Smp2) [Carpediemonas membranifera]